MASVTVLAIAALNAAIASAATVTINFEDLMPNTILSNQYAPLGVTFVPNVFNGAGTSTSGSTWATNTDMTIVASTGTDVGGLGTPALVSGNLLRSFSGWLNEDGDASFAVNFATPISSFSATFAGVFTGVDVTIYPYNGATPLTPVSGAAAGQFVLSFASATPFDSVRVRPGSFNDWVGVDNITFTTAAVAPVLQNAVSRKAHGGAGNFDLPLAP